VKRTLVLLFLAAAGFGLVPACAQYGERQPLEVGSPQWASIGPSFIWDYLNDDGEMARSSWATTFHAPEGKSPPEPDYERYNDALESDDDAVFDPELQKIEAYVTWQTMYSPLHAQDDDLKTCWAVEGKGIGDVLVVKVDARHPVSVWGGFQKSADLYLKNSRPRKIRVFVLEPSFVEASQTGVSYQSLKVVGWHEVELTDTFGKQALPIPPYWPTNITTHPDGSAREEATYESLVAIQILSVYPGSKYDDLCISEVSN